MSWQHALAALRVLLYFSAIVGLIVAGMFVDSDLAQAFDWDSGRASLGHLLWVIGACICAGGLVLRLLGGNARELAFAWLVAQLCLAAAVGSETTWRSSSFWEWLAGLSIPLALWLPGVGLGSLLRRRSSA